MQVQRAGSRARISVSRDEFEKATSDLIAESLTVVDRVIASAEQLGTPRPSRVILVGGASRMVMVKAALEKHLKVGVKLNEPDLAVAKGAAIHAMSLTGAISQQGDLDLAPSGGAHRWPRADRSGQSPLAPWASNCSTVTTPVQADLRTAPDPGKHAAARRRCPHPCCHNPGWSRAGTDRAHGAIRCRCILCSGT